MSGPLVGIVPACGHARRLGALPFSKELYPLPLGPPARGGEAGLPRPVIEHLLEAFAGGGVGRAVIALRPGKADVMEALGSGRHLGLELAYVCLEESPSVPHTVARALRQAVDGAHVVLGFPDMVFAPGGLGATLVRALAGTRGDVALALFPADRPTKCDLVRHDAHGRIAGFVVKPARTELTETWALAAWSERFSRFLRDWVAGPGRSGRVRERGVLREAAMSDVFAAALGAGLRVAGVRPPPGARYIDIGTPDDLARAIAHLGGMPPPLHSSARAAKGSDGRRRR